MSDRQLVVIGAGGHAREIHALMLDAGSADRLIGFAEEGATPHKLVHGLPVFDIEELVRHSPSEVALCSAIGSPRRRQLVSRLESLGFDFEGLWHPSARRGFGVDIGRGSTVASNVILVADVRIGAHVLLNVGSVISHDAHVGDFTTVSPGVFLNGGVHVGSDVFIGTQATVVPRVTIGDGSTVGAASCVTRDVDARTTVAGVPARVIAGH